MLGPTELFIILAAMAVMGVGVALIVALAVVLSRAASR
jgi:hypothetical protein